MYFRQGWEAGFWRGDCEETEHKVFDFGPGEREEDKLLRRLHHPEPAPRLRFFILILENF